MLKTNRLVAATCAAALFLAGCAGANDSALPAIAQGPLAWNAQAGASANNEAIQALQFYPATITIDAGDSITWKYPAGEPHTVTFLGPRNAPPPPSDPSVPAPAGGSSYDGSTYTSSGFMLGGASYKLSFPKAGVYSYYCLIHGEMVGKVIVQVAGTPYPVSAAQIASQNAAQITADLNSANAAVAKFPYAPGGSHLAAGFSPGMGSAPPTSASVVRFIDGDAISDTTVTVSAGSTVTWTNLDSNLPHTVTFAPAGTPFPNMDPFSPPSGGNTYDGTTLVNSGPLFAGQSFSLQLRKPGTYTYHCLFHDDTENMIGTIVVQ